MKCPLIKKRFDVEQGENFDEPLDCLKEGCAWWLDNIQMCAVRDLALETGYTQHRLKVLNEYLDLISLKVGRG